MRTLEEMDFPTQVAETIISNLEIDEQNLQEVKDLIYFVNELSPQETKDLINELFQQVGV